MTELYNFFRGAIVLAFFALVLYLGAQIVPQIQTAATLPARISADNAQSAADALAAPTYTALRVRGTAQAIENERTQAQAAADAQTIAAQGAADAARTTANALQIAVYGVIGLLLAAVLTFGALVMFRAHSAQRTHRAALELARAGGGVLELPNGHRIAFPERVTPAQLDAPHPERVEISVTEQTQNARKRAG